jgi:ProP effector
MSHPSLQEQLKALSLQIPSDSVRQKKFSEKKLQKRAYNTPEEKLSWLERVRYGVELLKAYFPDCFREGTDIKPLKVGIKKDLVLMLAGREDIAIGDKACMVSSLCWYVNASVYHQKMKEGAIRIDLKGLPAGTVTAEEAAFSAAKQDARRKKSRVLPIQEMRTEVSS